MSFSEMKNLLENSLCLFTLLVFVFAILRLEGVICVLLYLFLNNFLIDNESPSLMFGDQNEK